MEIYDEDGLRGRMSCRDIYRPDDSHPACMESEWDFGQDYSPTRIQLISVSSCCGLDRKPHTANIAGVENGFAITFYEKHYGACAMICIEEGDTNREPWGEFDFRGCIQWNWPLLGSEMTFRLKGMNQPEVCIDACSVTFWIPGCPC